MTFRLVTVSIFGVAVAILGGATGPFVSGNNQSAEFRQQGIESDFVTQSIQYLADRETAGDEEYNRVFSIVSSGGFSDDYLLRNTESLIQKTEHMVREADGADVQVELVLIADILGFAYKVHGEAREVQILVIDDDDGNHAVVIDGVEYTENAQEKYQQVNAAQKHRGQWTNLRSQFRDLLEFCLDQTMLDQKNVDQLMRTASQ